MCSNTIIFFYTIPKIAPELTPILGPAIPGIILLATGFWQTIAYMINNFSYTLKLASITLITLGIIKTVLLLY